MTDQNDQAKDSTWTHYSNIPEQATIQTYLVIYYPTAYKYRIGASMGSATADLCHTNQGRHWKGKLKGWGPGVPVRNSGSVNPG